MQKRTKIRFFYKAYFYSLFVFGQNIARLKKIRNIRRRRARFSFQFNAEFLWKISALFLLKTGTIIKNALKSISCKSKKMG